MAVPQKIKLLYDPAISLLRIELKKMKAGCGRDIYTSMFITALFTIDKTWKQHTHPLTGGWIGKMWYIHTIEYCLALQRKKSLFVFFHNMALVALRCFNFI